MTLSLFLICAVVMVAFLSLLIWIKTGAASFVLGLFFVYFWSLHGAFNVIGSHYGTLESLSYDYIELRLFPIDVSQLYYRSIIYYSLFIVIMQLIILFFSESRQKLTAASANLTSPIEIDHYRVMLVSGALILLSTYLGWEVLSVSFSMGISAYVYLYQVAEEHSSLWLITDMMAVITAVIGFSVAVTGREGRYIVGEYSRVKIFFYLCLLFLIILFNISIGRKYALFVGSVTGFLFYLTNAVRPSRSALVFLGLAALTVLGFINIARGGGVQDYGANFSLLTLGQIFLSIIYSNEAYAAHFSMYGALHFHVPIEPWISFKVLVLSLVPAFFGMERPLGVYDLYAQGVDASETMGFTIHHATGWYLNFGVIGIVIGAAILSGIWVTLYNRHCRLLFQRPRVTNIFWSVASSAFVAQLPGLIRSGPEGYRGVFLAGIIVPAIILTLCSRPASSGFSVKNAKDIGAS